MVAFPLVMFKRTLLKFHFYFQVSKYAGARDVVSLSKYVHDAAAGKHDEL